MNLPSYDFLSAPLWLVNILHVVTLTLHLVAMNFVFGGLVAILFGRIDNRWQNAVVQRYLKLLPTAMAATVTFGVAPLLFAQLVFPRQIYGASIISSWFWLMIIPVAIVGYYFLYAASFSRPQNTRKGLFLAIALLGMTYISLVYSSVFSLAENPDLRQELYSGDQSGLVLNPNFGDYVFRWLHMVFGAVTVGGFFVGWLGKDDSVMYAVGKQFFLWGMVVASLFGVIYLITLGDILRPFMRTPGIWALTVGIVLSVGSLHFFFKKKFVPSAIMVLVSVLMMVYSRHHVRLLSLADHYDPASVPIGPQWSMFALFLICFVVAVGLVWYMLRLFFTSKPSAG
jgi:hypothetical protein